MNSMTGNGEHPTEILGDSTRFSFNQLCQMCQVSPEMVHRMVAEGILRARGSRPSRWVFEATSITRVRRARRLRRDLELDYSGLALALDLMEERDRLEREVQSLRFQLQSVLGD
jgi:chaperone modulatory protein CbpM